MKLIILGAPGCGKGTQAKKICAKFNIAHISTGDILREEIKKETELGITVKNIMSSGDLVPDEIVINLIRNRIEAQDCKNGFIFDGFPRTVNQAEKISQLIKIDLVIAIRITNETVIQRISGRRTCVKCGEIYHTSTHKSLICDKCVGSLIQRDDEKEETVLHRLQVFEKQTLPLFEFFEKQGNLFWVNSEETIDATFDLIDQKLSGLGEI